MLRYSFGKNFLTVQWLTNSETDYQEIPIIGGVSKNYPCYNTISFEISKHKKANNDENP